MGRARKILLYLLIAAAALALTGLTALLGGAAGFQSAQSVRQATLTFEAIRGLQEQFLLAQEDISAGRLDVARQRLEYILERNPGFPGAADRLQDVLVVLFATSTPTVALPSATPTLTATPDLRPMEERFAQAQQAAAEGRWAEVEQIVLAMRASDLNYRQVETDGLLYLALRHRGVERIVNEADLGGGIYDLTQAERFGPLDAEADHLRSLARLYMIGSGFWEVYPQQAAYYFGIVSAAFPYLRDASGFTAFERYRLSILQYADQLAAKEDWCGAVDQYDLALRVRDLSEIYPTATYAANQCYTPTPGLTETPTLTPTWTPTLLWSPTPTLIGFPTATDTPTSTPTVPGIASPTPTSTPTLPALPSDTPTVEPPTPTETPTPEAPTATPPDGSGP